jgi:hypothetical protein
MPAASQLLTAWHTAANLTLSSPPVQRPLIGMSAHRAGVWQLQTVMPD